MHRPFVGTNLETKKKEIDMSNETVTLSGPISIKDNSKERVAFDLMSQISNHEPKDNPIKNRQYYLTLYTQCLSATSGYPLNNSLNPE